jgi:hypothetical protein
MTLKPTMKKMLVTGLAATMLLSGGASAFADGKGKDRDKRDDKKIEFKGNINIILSFPDVQGGDVEWAVKYIASLASKRVFEGYEDGTFQPRKPITRIEAITAAVRLMGLRDQAESSAEMSTALNFKDAEKIKREYPWATGYVAVALENDLFMESDESVQPEKPADRLWATTLLVKALKLSAEAKSNMNVTLPYKDAREIPAGSVGYVEVARLKGLIDGYEDTTFRPNKPVTRAELAALLDRTGEQLPGSGTGTGTGTDQTQLTGKLAAAVTGNSILLESNGQSSAVAVDANAFIYRNGTKAALTELKAGDVLKVRTYNNVAYYIEVTQLAPAEQNAFTVFGLYNDMTLTAEGKIATIKITQNINGTVQDAVYGVSSNVSISGGTLPAANKVLELKGSNTTVTQIKIL